MNTERTFQNILDYWASIKPDETACFDELCSVTYKEMADACNALAISLTEKGVVKGDKILTLMRNSYEFIIIYFASVKMGAVLVPCNATSGKFEIEKRLKMLAPKVVFTSEDKWLTTINRKSNAIVITVRFGRKGNQLFDELVSVKPSDIFKCAEIDVYDDIFAIVITSGSTCEGKGVMLTYDNILHSAVNIGEQLECTDKDVFFVPLPFSHMFCLNTGILTPFYFGCKIILAYKFEANRALDLIEQNKATVHLGVPTMFIRELHEQSVRKRDMTSLRTGVIAGAGCSANLVCDIETHLHCKILIAYGSTESNAVSMTSLDDDPEERCSTVGRIFDTTEVKILNDDGSWALCGERGEILCKGRSVMKGYLNGLNETGGCGFDLEGWHHTGDVGAIDKGGFLKVIGRKKDIIIRGGYNVSPSEIEEALFDHPDVLEVCALGESNEDLGERICLFVVPNDNSNITVDSIKNYVVDRVARYKQPDCIVILDAIPKLENGKYDCCLLRRMLKNKN